MKGISGIKIVISDMSKRLKQLIITQRKQMNIFTICNKGKDNFIEGFIRDVKAVFCAVKGSKSFSKTPERCDDPLKAGCLLEERVDQLRAGFGMVSLNPCAGVEIEIIQGGLLLSHVKNIIAELVRRLHIAIKYFAGFGDSRLFCMERSL